MKTKDLDFNLPPELIATKPAEPRDSARLLVINKKNDQLQDTVFTELPNFLEPGDLLVFNETKVFPARLKARKETGGELEILFLTEIRAGTWEVMIGGKVKEGSKIFFQGRFLGVVAKKTGPNVVLQLEKSREEVFDFLSKHGSVPLPPYINRNAESADKKDYQTVFARNLGSAAAPTASLHFTAKLIERLEKAGVDSTFVTLHVGLGTFAPVKTEILEEHPIHSEYFEVSAKAAEKITKAKKEGRRVIAVGTTVVRTLEGLAAEGKICATKGEVGVFIYPGFEFRIIDGLITNFHTPKSSLLALVFAFLGQTKTKEVYRHVIKNKYRFYSYGDGMLIL